jgi:hypothetical protein
MEQQPSRILCLWPGLAGLWLRGRLTSLLLAAGFSLLLNVVLAGSLIWPELTGSMFRMMAWPAVAIVWILSTWHSWKTLGRLAETTSRHAPDQDALFIQAQSEYLNGNWVPCEQLIARQLRQCPRDLESRLLLATMFRRTGRMEAARRQLDTLCKFDGWQQWQLEIARERTALERVIPEDDEETPPEDGSPDAGPGPCDDGTGENSDPETELRNRPDPERGQQLDKAA